MKIVAKGVSVSNFIVAYNRQLEDCTSLNSSAVKIMWPIVMTYILGAGWNVLALN